MLRASSQRSNRIHLLLMMLVGLVLLTFSTGAYAQSRTALRVDVIVASNAGTGVDASLAPHAGRLRAQFPSFDSFASQGVQQLRLAVNESASFRIPGGGNVTITQTAQQGNRASFNVAVPGGTVNIELAQGGLIFVGGPRSPSGVVILMIRN